MAARLTTASRPNYDTTEEEACQWLCARADDFEAWIPSIGSAAIA